MCLGCLVLVFSSWVFSSSVLGVLSSGLGVGKAAQDGGKGGDSGDANGPNEGHGRDADGGESGKVCCGERLRAVFLYLPPGAWCHVAKLLSDV